MQGEEAAEKTVQEVQHKQISTTIASRYNASSEYLDYILELEKDFDLKPYSFLALIAQ